MSKFNETFNIRVSTEGYSVNETIEAGDYVVDGDMSKQRVDDLGGIHYEDLVFNNTESEQITQNGGRFEWAIYENGNDKPLVNVMLMRLWCTQMFVQIAKGKAFTNEADAGVEVLLSDEELEQLDNIANKVYVSLHKETYSVNESLVTKRKPKKLDF